MNERTSAQASNYPRSLEAIRTGFRALQVAFVAGCIWSLGNAAGWQLPSGMDVVRGPVPKPLEGALWRAAALVFVAVTLVDRRVSVRIGSLGAKSMATNVAAIATIACLFGLLFGSNAFSHPISLAFAILTGWSLLKSSRIEVPIEKGIVTRLVEHRPDDKETGPSTWLADYPVTLAMRIGLFLSGVGLAIALQGLDARLALWGYGEPAEATLRGVIFLSIAAFGGLAFSGLLGKPVARHLALVGAPLYVTATCVVSLSLLTPLTGHDGLDTFMRSFGADLSSIGSLKGTALIAARGLFLPALAVGILLSATGRKATLQPLLLGIALGVAALPLIPVELHLSSSHTTPFARGTELCMIGTIACLAGWLALAFTATPNTNLRKRFLPLLVIAPLIGIPLGYDAPSIRPLSPWLSFEAAPIFIEDTPDGLLTVEPTKNGAMVVTLDRFRMTPDVDFEASDSAQLRASLDFITETLQGSKPTIRVLLAGQMTIGRWDTFLNWKSANDLQGELEWTVPWEGSVNQIRPSFEFAGAFQAPLSQAEARQKLEQDHFDLVVTLATYGPEITALSAQAPPMAAGKMAGSGGTEGSAIAIAWLDTRTPLAYAELGSRALLAGSDLEHMAVGLISARDALSTNPTTLQIPNRFSWPDSGWTRLSTRPELRAFTDRAQLFARLARRQNDTPPTFLSALSDLLALQTESSPWDEPDVRFEIETEALQGLFDATPPIPSTFQRTVWNHVARILSAKRLPEDAYAFFPALLAQTETSWPQIEYALSRAYQEFLMPKEAADLLSPLFESGQLNLVPLLEYAACEGQTGNWKRAAEVLTQAYAKAPDNHNIERHLAIAEMQAGLPTGPARIQSVIDKDPDDAHNQKLEAYLQPGPMPAAPTGFNPTPLSDHEDH